ncbi:uncharacterized protein LOC136070424 [Quercus suber]|uniref:uncharacterized protein LOC136070424 n=1 Tax=Quercus suber TaxID=58331 RepID=UPI0032DF157B
MRTNEQPFPIQQIFLEVQEARASFVRTIPPRPPDQPSQTPPRLIWKPPPWSKLKVNFDWAVFREDNLTGIGVIVRNGEGRVMASMAESFQLPLSITAVEVIAAKKALQFAIDLGLSSIVLEGDSKITIDGRRGEELSLAEYGHLLDEAKDIAKQFAEVEFNHVLRQANKAARNIARHARHVSKLSV